MTFISAPFRRRTIGLLLMVSSIAAFGQSGQSLTLHVAVNPPYSPYLSDWLKDNSKVLVTLIPAAGTMKALSIRLEANLSGSNGITIATQPGYSGSGPIMVMSGMPLVLTTNDIKGILDPDHLVFTNISKSSIISSDGLPEGMYTLCLRAYDYSSNQPVSAEGCSAPFTIVHPDPPVIMQPQNNDTVTASAMQHLQFTWTPSAGAPAGISYSLRIVEMIPSARDPQDALSSTYTFLMGQLIPITSRLVGPSDPQLVPGHRYVAVVTASDPLNRVVFKNNGVSDPVVFVYGRIPEAASTGSTSASVSNTAARSTGSMLGYSVPLNTGLQGNIWYKYPEDWNGVNPGWPLKGIALKLVVRYVLHTGSANILLDSTYTLYNNNKTLATAITDSAGGFSFAFLSTDSMGCIQKNDSIDFGGGEFHNFKKGDLYRIARIVVQSPYYLSPATDFTLTKGVEQQLYENIFTKVRSYALTVTVRPFNADSAEQLTNAPLGGVKVYMLRQNRPADVPSNEGMPRPAQPMMFNGMEVVAQGTTLTAGAGVGTVTFTHLVKNVNDQYVIHAEPDSTGQYWFTTLLTDYHYGCPADFAMFSGEYSYPTAATNYTTYSLNPRIAGFVYRADNLSSPIAGAQVTVDALALFIPYAERTVTTSPSGGFVFDNLTPQYNGSGNFNGLIRWLAASKPGFKDVTINNLPLLKLGQQAYLPKILMSPDFSVYGTVMNENGNGVDAHVQIGDGAQVHTIYSALEALNQSPYGMTSAGVAIPPLTYVTPAAGGAHQRIIVEPDDEDTYFPETTWVDIIADNQKLAPITVYQRKQRLAVYVIEGNSGAAAKTVFKAHVQIANVSPALLTDESGTVHYSFKSAASSFTVNVWSPDSSDYLSKTVNVNSAPSKNETAIDVSLTKAARVSGSVSVGRGLPVAGARVFIDGRASMVLAQTTTDAQGRFVLRNVPIADNIIVKAAKSGADTTFVGAQATVNVPAGGVSNVGLMLTVYDAMDITRLLGFRVEIDSLVETNGTVRIRGALVHLPSNPRFTVADSQARMVFPPTTIVPGPKNAGGIPTAQPSAMPLVTDLNAVHLGMGALAATLRNGISGLSVSGSGSQGVISGHVVVSTVNFSTSGASLNGFSLLLPGAGSPAQRLTIPAINATGGDPLGGTSSFCIGDSIGGSFAYTLHGFPATTLSDSSYVNNDTVLLATTLHTHIAALQNPDLNLALGRVRITTVGVVPIAGSAPLAFPVGQWGFSGTQWSLSSSGLMVQKGAFQTKILPIPFTNLKITPSGFDYGTFTLDTLRMPGNLPLVITGKAQFGLAPDGNFALSVGPSGTSASAAWATNLPGCGGSDNIVVNNFYLKSNGDKGFTLDNTTPGLTLQGFASFSPTAFQLDSNALVVPGMIDLHMPLAPVQPTSIMFSAGAGGKSAFGFQPFTLAWNQNGMQVTFNGNAANPQTLDSTGFAARGTVSETGKFTFVVNLKRALDSIGLTVEPGQQQIISSNGQRTLQAVSGGMHVENGAWNNFHFEGDLTGAKGAAGRLAFIAYGDIVADNQQVGVTNMPTPFGNMKLTYEPENHRLVGNLHVSQSVSGAYSVEGDADAAFDDQGWYFLCAGDMQVNNPQSEGTALTIIGNYPMTQVIRDIAAQYSYVYKHKGALPTTFPDKVSGFFFEGMTSFPVQSILGLPNIDIDLVVVSADLWVNAGADFRMCMGFDSSVASIGAGMDVFYDAGMNVGASCVIACAGVTMGGILDEGWDGGFTTAGDWYADASGDLTLYGSAYCGEGVCDADCDGLCDKHDWSGSKTFGIKGHIGSDGKHIDIYVK